MFTDSGSLTRFQTYVSRLTRVGQRADLVVNLSTFQRKRGRRTKPAPDGPRQGAQQNRTWPTPPSGGVAASSASAEYKNPKVQVGGFVWKQFLTHTRQFKLSAGLRSAARIRKFLLVKHHKSHGWPLGPATGYRISVTNAQSKSAREAWPSGCEALVGQNPYRLDLAIAENRRAAEFDGLRDCCQ